MPPETETETTARAEAPKQNGIKRPEPGSITGRLWDIADRISAQLQRPAPRKQVVDAYMDEVPGANQATANTQYARWVVYHDAAAALRESRATEIEERRAAKQAERDKLKADAQAKRDEEKAAEQKARDDAKAAKEAERAAAKETREKEREEAKAAKAREREEKAAAKQAERERVAAERAAAQAAAASTQPQASA